MPVLSILSKQQESLEKMGLLERWVGRMLAKQQSKGADFTSMGAAIVLLSYLFQLNFLNLVLIQPLQARDKF